MSNDFFLTDRLDAVQAYVKVSVTAKEMTFKCLWPGPAANVIAYFDGECMHKIDTPAFLIPADTLSLTVRLGK